MKRDFLKLNDLSRDEFEALFEKSAEVKDKRVRNIPHQPLKGKSLGMIFEKHSTRTRISFEVGMFELGGHGLLLDSRQMQLGRGESIEDSAQVLSRYLHGIMIRTYEFEKVETLARHATIPVINGLTDLNHPVQVLCDLFTIREKRGKVDGIKVAYVGDGNNVAYSWAMATLIFDIQLSVACPGMYQLKKEDLPETSARIELLEDPYRAVKDADVIYTDVWVSMGQEESEAKIERLKPYQINQNLVNAAGKEVLVMHCLPAHRGLEITADVLDGPCSIVFDQAENRLHVQKALMEKLLT